jgi:hypothetical protein
MLKYLQIYCFDTCKALPIYHIFDEANTFTPIYFSSKDKCKDRKDDNRFGIDFVECEKIVRFKIGNKMIFGILFMSNLKKKNSIYGNLDICLY